MKIKEIKEVQTEYEDVYDITVPKYHNFLVDSGVFVHNCCQIIYSIFTNPIQANIMDIASSITKSKIPDKELRASNYNISKSPMSHRKATELAFKMFNKR